MIRKIAWCLGVTVLGMCCGVTAYADQPGYQLVETLWVDASSAAGVWSAPLEAGANYRLEASGYFTAGYWYWNYSLPVYADAIYLSTGPVGGAPEEQWNPYVQGNAGLGGAFLWIDGSAPEWGPYAANHTYAVDIIGSGEPAYAWVNDGFYADNAGGLTVSVYRELPQRYRWLGFLPPLTAGGNGLFKRGSTIPVKFKISDLEGNPVSNCTATLEVYYWETGTGAGAGDPQVVSSANGDSGNTFRYVPADDLYIFNLSTRPWQYVGSMRYQIVVALDDGQEYDICFSLR